MPDALFRNIKMAVSLAGVPLIWFIQINFGEALASRACYPHETPRDIPLWDGLAFLLGLLAAGSFLAGLSCFFVACRYWQQARRDEGVPTLLAGFGLMSSAIFMVAILYTAAAAFLVSPCAPWGTV